MHPILIELGGREGHRGFIIGTYALLALLALAAGVALFSWLARRDGHSAMSFVELGLWAFIIALLASKVFGAAMDFDANDWKRSLTKVLRYGGHYYIGFLAGVAYLVVGLRRRGVALPVGLDYLAPALALAHGIGRIGCYFAGCCWGKACDLAWAVTFRSEDAHRMTGVPMEVPLHPTQLYEAGAEIAIAGLLLLKFFRARWVAGSTFLTYLVIYGITRFSIEFLRGDPRGTLFGWPTSQPLAALSALLGATLLAILWSSKRLQGGNLRFPTAPGVNPGRHAPPPSEPPARLPATSGKRGTRRSRKSR